MVKRFDVACQVCGRMFRRYSPSGCCSERCRFFSRVQIARGGCWLWIGRRNADGYGCFSINSSATLAHRYMYEMARGPIPRGLEIDHLCRTRRCINPDHLEAVTKRVNALRGAAPTVILFHRKECRRGHKMTPENTAIHRRGDRTKRVCRACIKMRAQRAAGAAS